VLLGASSSGKSTLLNILSGLDTPTAGAISYLDHDLTHAGEAARTRFRREHVVFVFQFNNLIPSLTALENVQLVTEISPQPLDPAEALTLAAGRHWPSHSLWDL
jgi:putative ABC transport system ATP-binding protein